MSKTYSTIDRTDSTTEITLSEKFRLLNYYSNLTSRTQTQEIIYGKHLMSLLPWVKKILRTSDQDKLQQGLLDLLELVKHHDFSSGGLNYKWVEPRLLDRAMRERHQQENDQQRTQDYLYLTQELTMTTTPVLLNAFQKQILKGLCLGQTRETLCAAHSLSRVQYDNLIESILEALS